MNSATNRDAAKDADTTPGTDMQPEDAGTPASGNSGRGTAAEGALKQTSKTATETGTSRGDTRPTDRSNRQGRT
jgi:hypothetical protein